jgi:hypothetical protein
MRRDGHPGLCPVSFAEWPRRAISVLMDRSVPIFVLEELAKHPRCEEGGKYLGFIENEGESTRIVVTDFLPGGPNAKRTRVEFLPDGDFQERLFRQAERVDRRVEHLGSWHSHHCNGLGTFSEGDISGYFKTVNKAQYRPDFFVASLVKRIPRSIEESDWLQHFLFVRGDDQFYRLDNDLRIVDAPTTFGDITGHSRHRQHALGAGERSQNEAIPSRVESVNAHVPGKTLSGLWYESEIGRSVLAKDRSFFSETIGSEVKATRKDGRIRVRVACRDGSEIAITYPLAPSDEMVEVSLSARGSRPIAISCHLGDRLVAVKGALFMEDML